MKNKWYLIMGIFACVLSLFGCSEKRIKPDEEIASVSIYQSHMDSTYCYSFFARNDNGSYLLDASCVLVDYDKNDFTKIDFADKEISEEDFRRFIKLDDKYDYFSMIKPIKEKKSILFALDETVTNFSVKYGDESFSLYTYGDCYNEVYDLFVSLAEKYNNKS